MRMTEKEIIKEALEMNLPRMSADTVYEKYLESIAHPFRRNGVKALKAVVTCFIVVVICTGVLCVFSERVRAGIGGFLYALTGSEEHKEWQIKTVMEEGKNLRPDDWHYDPEVIDEEQIERMAEVYAKVYGFSKEEYVEDQLKRAREQRALYRAAKDAGIEVSEEELDKAMDAIREGYKNDSDIKKLFDMFCDINSISIDDYIENYLQSVEKVNRMGDKYIRQTATEAAKNGSPKTDQEILREVMEKYDD